MNQLFNYDNPIMQFISKIFDLIILNLFFLLFSIPIVTMGASLSALYYVCLKLLRGEEPYIWQNFFKAFRQTSKLASRGFLERILAKEGGTKDGKQSEQNHDTADR